MLPFMWRIETDSNPEYPLSFLPPFKSRVTANGKGGSTPRSGHQYSDQFAEFMDALWVEECIRTKKVTEAVDVDKPSLEEQQGGGSSPGANGGSEDDIDDTDSSGQAGSNDESPTSTTPPALAGGAPARGGGEPPTGTAPPAPGVNSDNSGAAAGGDELDPEPETDSPDYPAWVARRAAMLLRSEKKSKESHARTVFPDRPKHWMHYLSLTFCFFGRPAGKNEDVELRLCKAGSGPEGDRTPKVKKEKKAKQKSSDEGSDSSDDSSPGPSNPLSAAAVKHLVGAGEPQSRASVKKAAAKIESATKADAMRKEGLELVKGQAEVSKEVANAVKQVAADVRIQRQLEEENACRKRKQGAIGDLRMELEFADGARAQTIRSMIGKLCRKNVSDFTADFTVASMDTDAPPACATTASVSAPAGFTSV